MNKTMETPCKTEDDCDTPMWFRSKSRCPKRGAKEEADEAHRHLYHPWWSVKEMEAIATLAHRHHMNPVELIRDAVSGWDQAWQIRHSARFILEDANPEKLAEACGLPMGVIVSALENILPNACLSHGDGSATPTTSKS